jgi:hypothetical protein
MATLQEQLEDNEQQQRALREEIDGIKAEIDKYLWPAKCGDRKAAEKCIALEDKLPALSAKSLKLNNEWLRIRSAINDSVWPRRLV